MVSCVGSGEPPAGFGRFESCCGSSAMKSLISIAVLGVLFAGCTTCSRESRWSVRVSVEGSDGAPLAADAVTFAYAGEPVDRDCLWFEAEDLWTCGEEADGALVVSVVRGTQRVDREVTVSADECHVRTEEITVVLDE